MCKKKNREKEKKRERKVTGKKKQRKERGEGVKNAKLEYMVHDTKRDFVLETEDMRQRENGQTCKDRKTQAYT